LKQRRYTSGISYAIDFHSRRKRESGRSALHNDGGGVI